MITIPSLENISDISDTDVVMVTTSEGQSYKMAGSEINKRHKGIIANSTTVTGAPLKTGNIIRIHFTADITSTNSNTALTINYNTVNYPVKIAKNGALASYNAFERSGTFKYVQAYTTLEFIFDGTNFVLIGNPVVWSGTGFTIFANTSISKSDVGLGSVANTGDSATPVSGGTTKFTTGGAYTELNKKVDKTSIGAASGIASLDSSGKVPSTQLPSYVDDVLEYASLASFPATGETGKIYVAKDTNKSYRWSGSAYIELSSYAEASQSASGLMSAADKTKLDGITKGSAAGNVPLIGTALGTTNNNIVVTDANGKLKPSGTAIGSAAGKTAGSAAGNVPLIGTALGTTNNNIVVTDANGKLKPSGTVIGDSASYDVAALKLLMYPVGSIYWTGKAPDNGGDPAALFGGTWTQIKDKFIWAKGDSDTLGATGGEKTVTLTLDQMPSHSHTTVSQSSSTTGKQSANESFSGSNTHNHELYGRVSGGSSSISNSYPITDHAIIGHASANLAYQDKVIISGTSKKIINDTTITISGTCTGDHTHSFAHTHTTNSKGNGNSHNNMPPYIVKYCWERTA